MLEHGVSTTTVQHILKEANVSRRTYYQYFKSRDAAYVALYGEAISVLVANVSRAVSNTEDQSEKIVAGIMAYLQHQHDSGPLLWALQRMAVQADSPLAPLRDSTINAMVTFIDEQFKEVAGLTVDPLLFRGLVLSLDGIIRHLQDTGSFGEAELVRVQGMVEPVIHNVFKAVPHLPDYTAP